MRVHCQGARFHASQVQRIEEGFRQLGHEVIDQIDAADLIFVNNPWFDQIVKDKAAGQLHPSTRLVLNVQDIPHHCPDYDVGKLAAQLQWANTVTSISATTAADLKRATGIDSTVIYQPIMPITRGNDTKYPRYRALFCGRVYDANKRTHLAAHAMQMLGWQGNEIVTVGMESPPFGGEWWGIATESALNDLYGSVDYVVCTARYAGIELCMIEAMAAGAIPIVCRDLHTRTEFLAPFAEYEAVDPTPESILRFIAALDQHPDSKAAFKDALHDHYLTHWAEPFSPAGVAARIIQAAGPINPS